MNLMIVFLQWILNRQVWTLLQFSGITDVWKDEKCKGMKGVVEGGGF